MKKTIIKYLRWLGYGINMKKQLYKKVIKWEKKENKDMVYSGIGMIFIAVVMVGCLTIVDRQVAFLTMIFTLMMVYGFKLIFKGEGKGKNIYYIKK